MLRDGSSDDAIALAQYAERAYLEYALSVVKGRALPDVCDGQKPVQRRILYAMQRMGLGWGGPNRTTPAKPVKSARVVGDVLGRFHPHGDQAAYDALVRMAQDFTQRYPLIDGQGNFGSRDGDGAAAMRYTEARLSRISTLLLDEIDEGTVDYVPNYDGSTVEPRQLPARLPFVLLNGASGIAVGLATEIPSHNLREVADACVALLKDPQLGDEALFALLPGPDFPGGGQIISPAADIQESYRSGRGSLKVRARWTIEELARGQWQLVVHELPPGVSAQRVLEEIEDITNPKARPGKKALTPEQQQLKASMLALLDGVRDESGKDAPVRLVFEPKSSRLDPQVFINQLLVHTSLETSVPVNLTVVGADGRPVCKPLRQILQEWITFRQDTIGRRSRHRLERVRERIHLLEGRQLVLLHIDEVIAIIRESDDPKAALIARFALTERQADDILEIRLRQLARLEAIRIEQELQALREEQTRLEDILANPASLRRLMIREIEADAKAFGDARRTLIQAEKKAVAEIRVVDEPVTVVVSAKGWVRARTGHGHDAAAFGFKAGDALYGTFECRTVDTLIVLGSNGRVYSVPVASLPGARGDGQPITTLIELESGTQPLHFFAGPPSSTWLVSGSGGYGFLATIEDMTARVKGGKAFLTLDTGEAPCCPSPVQGQGRIQWGGVEGPVGPEPEADAGTGAGAGALAPATHVCCVSRGGRILTFAIDELKAQPKGGRGLMLMRLEGGDTLAGAAAYAQRVRVEGSGRGGKPRGETLEGRSLANALSARGRKGREGRFGFEPGRVWRLN
ncbi:DNA topoisomerase 4 subunit A [Tepidimonas taiwanensis]|uniref:DNA topoisomerase 4 subunit A n=2 Tax=Tepidimonas taiwanensis TaxID=307486 RepID=A0A554WYZ8_9BURK|nr:DNA topoisomerase IV subunit A [Tepidimonas taiwanensis]MCX7692190.1 DNA topoisomerase IV subunit A [Tepidimonas taiwanensis]TSE28802.1 DNA topoisomerase 4 subunit A [Tepidimonas taiwanensis]